MLHVDLLVQTGDMTLLCLPLQVGGGGGGGDLASVRMGEMVMYTSVYLCR